MAEGREQRAKQRTEGRGQRAEGRELFVVLPSAHHNITDHIRI
jgi:hypothetical protein